MLVKWGRTVALVTLLTSLTGCFGWWGGETKPEDQTPQYYVIDVDRGATAKQFASNRVVYIKPVRVVPHFEGKTLLFRVGENQFQAQPPHEFFSEPSEMFTSQVQRWLEKSGLFSRVVTEETPNADYVLETAVTALYGEKQAAYSPQAILEMQFFLTDAKTEQKLLFQTGLRVDADIDSTTPGNVVKGWKQGLEELLATLEQDLSGFFTKRDSR